MYVHIFEDARASDFFSFVQFWVIFEGSVQILRNNRGKISRSRKNRIFDFLNSGGGSGQSKVYVFFRGGSPKVYFVDKGEGGQKCVYVFYGRPLM